MGAVDAVTATFTFGRAEYLRVTRRLRIRRQMWGPLAFGALIVVAGLALSAWPTAAIGVVYVVGMFLYCVVIAPRRAWERHPQLRAEMTVRISDDGVEHVLVDARGRSDWKVWTEAVLIADIYVVTAKHRGISYVPRRAVESAEDECRLRELLSSHLRTKF